jgi:outer membrane biosynthesis protein TonB
MPFEHKRNNFNTALIISLILHLLLLLFVAFGLPSVITPLPDEENVMTFDVVSLDEVSNLKTQSPNGQENPEEVKSKEVKKSSQMTKSEETPEAKPEEKPEPKPQDKPEPEPKPEEQALSKPPEEEPTKIEDKPEEKIEEKKIEEKPAPKPLEKQKEKTPEKKEAKKAVKANNKVNKEDSIDSILKNLEEESQGSDQNAPAKNHNNQAKGDFFSQGAEYNEDSALSITETMLLKNQIQKHWTPPAAADKLAQVRVWVYIELEQDGVIKNIKIVQVQCPGGVQNTCNLVADSAVRAIKKSSPILNLPKNRYNAWKAFNLLFDPSSFAK